MSEPTGGADQRAARGAFETAQRWIARDGYVVTATVVGTWGSAPVPVGGQMVIAADADFQGSVSGGCVEGEVIAAAEDMVSGAAPRTLSFGVSDETAWGVGLPCGGEVQVLLERWEQSPETLTLLDRAIMAQEHRTGLVIETDLATGAKRALTPDSDGLDEITLVRFRSGRSQLVEADGRSLFHQALLPPARILVVGATHIAQLFCDMARLAGYEIVVIDPRTAFASTDRFPGVRLEADWPQDAIPRIGLDAYSAVVVVAHVSHIDDEALKLALRSDCLYVGALGSRRNHEKRLARLGEAGFTPAETARIKCPIGLDIGAQTPAEIAIGILAEVVLAVRGAKHPDRAITAGHNL